MMGLAEAAVIGWPLALTIAGAMAIERRRHRLRRAALNRALHELRRPLQCLALVRSAPAGVGRPAGTVGGEQLDAALAALDELDAEINGRRRPAMQRSLRADELVGDALERWRSPAALLGRRLELRWTAGRATVVGDPGALARALDNLLANSLEHGARRVRLEGTAAAGRLRIAVADGLAQRVDGAGALAGPLTPRPSRGGDPRHGHGLAVVAGIASAHGGRFAFSREGAGARAVLELPLASGSAHPGRWSAPSDAA